MNLVSRIAFRIASDETRPLLVLVIARRRGARVQVKTMTGNYGSIHGVPDDVLKAMADRFEPVSQSEISEYELEII